jgi:AraC-like DNA-binding protein
MRPQDKIVRPPDLSAQLSGLTSGPGVSMFVSGAMVRAVVQVCEARGVDADVLLAGSGLDGPRPLGLTTRVTSVEFDALCLRAVSLTGDPAIGLALATELPEHALQVVVFLLRAAGTLREAYGDFVATSRLIADNPRWTLNEHGEVAVLAFSCPIEHPTTQRIANDWGMALAYRMVCGFAKGPAERPTLVRLAHAAPSDLAPYTRHLPCQLAFGAARNELCFPRALLDAPQRFGDAQARSALRLVADELIRHLPGHDALLDRVRFFVHRTRDLGRLGVQELAAALGMSESALRRGLATEGASPSELLDDARRTRACAALARGEGSLKGLADALGYADVRSFQRAFKRWTGQSPSSYRRAHADGARS